MMEDGGALGGGVSCNYSYHNYSVVLEPDQLQCTPHPHPSPSNPPALPPPSWATSLVCS